MGVAKQITCTHTLINLLVASIMAEASVDFNAAEQPSPGFSLAYPANIGLVEEEVTDKQEASKGGRKRVRDPQSWTVKHVKKLEKKFSLLTNF